MVTWVSFLLVSSISFSAPPKSISGLEIKSNSNTTYALDKKYNVVLFLSSQCPCSMGHFDHLNTLAKNHEHMRFVGILSNEYETRDSAVKVFANASFPVVIDGEAKMADAFEAVKTPQVFVMDDRGEILFSGGVSDSSSFENAKQRYLETALDALAKNEKPKIREARALGCHITRK